MQCIFELFTFLVAHMILLKASSILQLFICSAAESHAPWAHHTHHSHAAHAVSTVSAPRTTPSTSVSAPRTTPSTSVAAVAPLALRSVTPWNLLARWSCFWSYRYCRCSIDTVGIEDSEDTDEGKAKTHRISCRCLHLDCFLFHNEEVLLTIGRCGGWSKNWRLGRLEL